MRFDPNGRCYLAVDWLSGLKVVIGELVQPISWQYCVWRVDLWTIYSLTLYTRSCGDGSGACICYPIVVTGSHDTRLFCPGENARQIEFKMMGDCDVDAVREIWPSGSEQRPS